MIAARGRRPFRLEICNGGVIAGQRNRGAGGLLERVVVPIALDVLEQLIHVSPELEQGVLLVPRTDQRGDREAARAEMTHQGV